jgi:hypothetical protein
MGKVCCICPAAWVSFVDDWVFVHVINTTCPFGESQWQLRQVHDTYLVLRRPIGMGSWQHAVVRCAEIVALVEAPPLVVG